MASVPQIPKLVYLNFGAVDYSDDVIAARLEFTPGAVQTITTLDGVVHQDIAQGTWNFVITCVQDWDNVRPGLAYHLNAAAGTTEAVTFNAHAVSATGSAGLPPVTFNVKLVPISYGGEGGVFATTEVTLPVDGTPVWDHTP